MAKSKNCPNCAAPYDVSLNKCPYCGTSYFDMSCINIDDCEPFYLKIRSGGCTFTSRVIARPEANITVTDDVVYAKDRYGHDTLALTTGRSMDIDLHFVSVPDNGSLCTVVLEDE